MIEAPAGVTSISARLAVAVLEWLIGGDHLRDEHDLCLVLAVPGFGDEPLPESVIVSTGTTWRLARVDGDFDLRMRLVEAAGSRLFAFTACDQTYYSADLRERAVLRYALRPLARHTFAALVGADASTLDDGLFSPALRDIIDGGRRDALLAAIRRRTWTSVVRESDATAVLCEAAFGFNDRYAEERPGELLARWLREPPLLTPSLYAFAREILARRYPLYAEFLASTPEGTPEAAFRRAARHDVRLDEQIVRLARDAAVMLKRDDADLLERLLRDAEAAYVAADSPPVEALLLHNAYRARARALGRSIDTANPPRSESVARLSAFVYTEPEAVSALLALARFARGLGVVDAATAPSTLLRDAQFYREHVAWLDRAARRVREAHFEDPETRALADGLLLRWYATRDRQNLAFGKRLASTFSDAFARPGSEAPYVVSHVLKHFVRPALAAKHRVFLVVLDGCDLATFLEIAEALQGAGAPLPTLDVALSAMPTITSHARRAIFAGKIPKDRPNDADASGDRKAFEGPNPVLDGFTRRLFLKGDLGDGGAELRRTLREATYPLVAAVFNDVDDAIASHETGVLAERTFERCTRAFREAMLEALDAGWQIVLTADHGHTPYRAPDVKMTLAHPRYAELSEGDLPPDGTVLFEPSIGVPYRLAAAYRMGAHAGPQKVGYHGGVSLEEMLVPLAFYGNALPDVPRYAEPSWWDDDVEPRAASPNISDSRSTPRVVAPTLPTVPITIPAAQAPAPENEIVKRCLAVLSDDVKLLALFRAIAAGGALDTSQIANATGLTAGRVRVNVAGLRDRLEAADIEPPFSVDDDPLVVRWSGPR